MMFDNSSGASICLVCTPCSPFATQLASCSTTSNNAICGNGFTCTSCETVICHIKENIATHMRLFICLCFSTCVFAQQLFVPSAQYTATASSCFSSTGGSAIPSRFIDGIAGDSSTKFCSATSSAPTELNNVAQDYDQCAMNILNFPVSKKDWIGVYVTPAARLIRWCLYNTNWIDSYTVAGSTDGTTWTKITTRTNSNAVCSNCLQWSCADLPSPSAKYNYFRFIPAQLIYANHQPCINELQLYMPPCSVNARIVNGDCECNSGYVGDGYTCVLCSAGACV